MLLLATPSNIEFSLVRAGRGATSLTVAYEPEKLSSPRLSISSEGFGGNLKVDRVVVLAVLLIGWVGRDVVLLRRDGIDVGSVQELGG